MNSYHGIHFSVETSPPTTDPWDEFGIFTLLHEWHWLIFFMGFHEGPLCTLNNQGIFFHCSGHFLESVVVVILLMVQKSG